MLPSSQFFNDSPSLSSQQQQPNCPTASSNTESDPLERLLRIIQQSNSHFESDSDDSGSIDIPHKRQKIELAHQPHNHHTIKNDLYPSPSKNHSPHPLEIPPPTPIEEPNSSSVIAKIKANGIQPIPPFRPKKSALLKDKENEPVFTDIVNIHLQEPVHQDDSSSQQQGSYNSIKKPLQQKDTTTINDHGDHSIQSRKLSIFRDDDKNNGKAGSNQKVTALTLSSVDPNLPGHRQIHHVKQQHELHQQQKIGHTASTYQKHQQKNCDVREPLSADNQIELTGKIQVNRHTYTILNKIGHGGSAAVYQVLHEKSRKILALKHVVTKHLPSRTERNYRNETNFFEKYQDRCPHMCFMYSYEFDRHSHTLNIILELGEMDFASFISMQKSKPLNFNFIRWFGQQMVEAVLEIHDANIIHRDLKPANFILKLGTLKLIDFGISKKLDHVTETTVVFNPTGTMNYMPPESFRYLDDGQKKYTEIGKPSDIWALGCIFYQMIYGHTPFYGIRSSQDKKRDAICDPSHRIDYPSVVDFNPSNELQDDGAPLYPTSQPTRIAIGKDAVGLLKSCLDRNPQLRITAKQLLEHPFFHPS